MFQSLRFRLWLTYAIVILVAVVILGLAFFIYLLSNPLESRQEVQRLRLTAKLIAMRWADIERNDLRGNQSLLEEFAARADENLSVRVALFRPDGELLVDSRQGEAKPLPSFSFLTRRSDSFPVIRENINSTWLFARQALKGGEVLVVLAPRPRKAVMYIFRNEFLPPILRGVIIALFLGILLSIWISRWVSAPLQRMASAAQGVAEGEYRPITIEGPSEVQIVGRAFNEMVVRVQTNQQAQREFLANVSHELKTPLTSIQGYAQAILDGTVESPQDLVQSAEVIHTEAERMHRMVQDLLEMARLDAGMVQIERVSLNLLLFLESIVVRWKPAARKAQVELHSQLDAIPLDYSGLYGDPDRLMQVFNNLLENAIKYTPRGGAVTLSACLFDGFAEISVADSGPGMPENELDRIFERFYQTDKSRRSGDSHGVGLGLSIARQIVEAHGGSITAHNLNDQRGTELAQGSIFVVKIPIAQGVSPPKD